MGTFPVTSRHPNSSMPEVCGRYDLGPPVPRGAVAIQSDVQWMDKWVAALVEAAVSPPERLAQRRREMMRDAREEFDWRAVVDGWEKHFVESGAVPVEEIPVEEKEHFVESGAVPVVEKERLGTAAEGVASVGVSGGTWRETLKTSRSSRCSRTAAEEEVPMTTSLCPGLGALLMQTSSVCSTTLLKRGPMRTYSSRRWLG